MGNRAFEREEGGGGEEDGEREKGKKEERGERERRKYEIIIEVGYVYEVVPKGSFTFLRSLCKEVAKTASGTLVYRFERQTARGKNVLRKTLCPRLRM